MDGTHLIDGCMKNPHINALDVRVHNATLFGDGVYITDGLDGLPIKVVNANTLSVGRGCMLVNGARITQEKLLNLTIESGQQNLNRNDLLVGTYTYDGANTRYEDVNFEIITGTPTSGTAADPTIHEGSLLDINNAALVSGVSTVQFPIARIPIKGISVGEPVILAKKFQSVAGLGDSVSRDGEWYIAKLGAGASLVFRHKEIASMAFEIREYVYKYTLPAGCGTPVCGFVNATQFRVSNARVTFPSSREVQVVTPITKAATGGTAEDPYYNNFDLVVICIK